MVETLEEFTHMPKLMEFLRKAAKTMLQKTLINSVAQISKNARIALTLEAKITVGRPPDIQFGR